MMPVPSKPKYQDIFDALSADIREGRVKPGDKLPSEAALVRKFNTSRITVGRSLRELQQIGLIDRIAGSGSYVRYKPEQSGQPLLFGLLIPDLGETEVFEPICQGIASAPEASDHALLWGHADRTRGTKEDQSWQLCQQFISRKVTGVFFAPLEFELGAEKVNRRILAALKEVGIAVVLLDRRPARQTDRNRPDLVGLNNRQAAYVATEHLIKFGCKRISFIGYHGAESTISSRLSGYREALEAHGLTPSALEPSGPESSVELTLPSAAQASVEAFVCVNDRVAAQLMRGFLAQKIGIPEEIRIVGIDDAPFASMLPVPLTTVKQPCRAIGEAALTTMLERLGRPKVPSRDLLLDGELIVRQSCGAHLSMNRMPEEIRIAGVQENRTAPDS